MTKPDDANVNARAFLAAIVDSADDAIIAKDTNGVIQSFNAAAERLFGYKAAEIVGKPVRVLIPADRQSEEDDILARIRRGERVDHFETFRVAKDGGLRHVSLTISPVRNDAGEVIGASKIARDIGERRSAEAAKAYLAAIVESSDDAIIAKDLNGIIQACNRTAERMFGYAASELIGRPVRILIPADRQSEEDNILGHVRRGEKVDHFETVRLTRDGRLLDVALTVSPVRDEAGRIIGVSKVARDITERKRAATELAAQQEWFRVTLGSIGDAVVATDVLGQVTFMNPVAEHLTGWRLDSARGRPSSEIFRIVNAQTRRRVESPITRVLKEGVTVGLANHTILISADGYERPVDDSGAPIRDRDGRIVGVVLVFRDVSERRRVETERQHAAAERDRLLEAERAARADAERASRVKDEFVAMVSHELRTPLNAILGWTELMLRNRHDPVMLGRGLDVVARNTRMQAQLISDLLDVSRITAGKLRLELQQVRLGETINEAIETVQQSADAKNIQIVREIQDDAAVIAGDPARLQQVVWNLLSNSIKFTPAGGRVTVGVRAGGGTATIVVSDTGIGIRSEFLPHVFERFLQADTSVTRRIGGLGLGLAIVKHVVEMHGGSVRAESEGEGRGATFTIVLPSSDVSATRDRDAAAAAAARVDYADGVSLDGIRVLVVEDEPDTREFLRRLLDSYGASVILAESATDALARFEAERPDILVSDIGLPEMDGHDLMRRIRRLDRSGRDSVPAIALTAYARSEDRTRALRAGYQAHMAKPVEPAELVATIASLTGLMDTRRPR
jgi:PAS domain S-box-containing protein